jgi:hypothetical protein
MPAGRPSKFTPAVRKSILLAIRQGLGRKSACAIAGVEPQGLRRLLKQKNEKVFVAQMAKAEAECERKHLNVITDSCNYKASAWFLERKWPKRWGKRDSSNKPGSGDTQAATPPIRVTFFPPSAAVSSPAVPTAADPPAAAPAPTPTTEPTNADHRGSDNQPTE